MPIIEDFLVNLAAGFTQTLLMALGKRVLGDPQQRALKRAYQAGFEAMLRTAGSGLSEAELAVVGQVIGRFLGQPTVAPALLDLGLTGAPLDVPALADRWRDAGGSADLVNIRFDFGWGLLAFQQGLTAALISEASRPDSALANQVTVTRLVALQGQVEQILDLLRAGPTAALASGAPTPVAPASAGPETPAEPPSHIPPPASPSTSKVQLAVSARYHSCFISYASKDQAFADRLHADLCAAGVVCWYAPEDMVIGDPIRKTIYAAIERLDKLLIILSRDSIASDWVEGEVERAFERERRQNETILFPIRLDDDVMDTDEAWTGDLRRTRHIGDFTKWQDQEAYQKALQRLLRDLRIGGDRFTDNVTVHLSPPMREPPTARALPHCAPRAPARFVGRTEYLETIRETVVNNGQSVGIYGMPGVGKTALARQVFNNLKSEFEASGYSHYFVGDNDTSTMISALASDFQVDLPDSFHSEAKRLKLRSALAGIQSLILLDDVHNIEVAQELVDLAPDCRFIVTSRTHLRPSVMQRIHLDTLPVDEAVALFTSITENDEDRRSLRKVDLIRQICEQLGKLPLAIEILACQVRASRITLELALDEVSKSTAQLGDLEYGDLSIKASFTVSFNRLSDSQRHLFCSLGALPGDDFSLDAAEQICKPFAGRAQITELASLSLLKPSGNNRFGLHPLIRSFALEKLGDADVYHHRAAKYYLEYARANRHPVNKLDIDAQNIHESLRWCDEQAAAGGQPLIDFLAGLLEDTTSNAAYTLYVTTRLYRRRGNDIAASGYYNQCLATARSLGDIVLEGACLRSLGEVCLYLTDDWKQGIRHLRDALALLRTVGDENLQARKEEVFTLNLLGRYYREVARDIPKFKEIAHQSLAVRDRIPKTEWGQHEGLSYAAAMLIDVYLTEKSVMQAYRILQAERDNLEIDLPPTMGHVAIMMIEIGEYPKAKLLLEQAQEAYAAVRNLGGCAWIMKCLGDLAQLQGHQRQALNYYQKALEYRQETGEHPEIAAALIDLIRISYENNEPTLGNDYWKTYLREYQKSLHSVQSKGHEMVASALSHLGRVLSEREYATFSVEVLQEAEQLYLKEENLGGAAYAKQLLGDCYLSIDKEAEAVRLYQEAIELRQRASEIWRLVQARAEICRKLHARGGWLRDVAKQYCDESETRR